MKESYQQQRKEHLIFRALQNIFLLKIKNVHPKFRNINITISNIEASKKVSYVKVFISVNPESFQKEIIDELNKNKSMIRGYLGNSLKDQLRIIPDIRFYLDERAMAVRRIEELLKDEVL